MPRSSVTDIQVVKLLLAEDVIESKNNQIKRQTYPLTQFVFLTCKMSLHSSTKSTPTSAVSTKTKEQSPDSLITMISQASFVSRKNHELHLQDLTATFDDSKMFQVSTNNNEDSELDLGMSISDFLAALRSSSVVESEDNDDDDDDSKSVDSITYYKRKGQLPSKESKD